MIHALSERLDPESSRVMPLGLDDNEERLATVSRCLVSEDGPDAFSASGLIRRLLCGRVS